MTSYLNWFVTLDHKRVGVIYFLLGTWGGFMGLSLSFLMRMNYLEPYMNVISPEVYKYVITSHGIAMMFFFLMPVLIGGFGNYLLPLLLGMPDLSLPRMKALSAWLLVPSAVCMGLSMLGGSGVGWTFYPPLSSGGYSGWGVDFLMFALHLAGVSSLFSSLNFMCTMHSCTKGFHCGHMPIIIWAYLFTSMLLLISLPVLAAGITMLLFDRNFGSSFFDPAGGGDPVLFQHLFWFFGHPEVYVLILPAFGIMSHMCIKLSKNDNLFGYYGLVFAMLAIVTLGSVVWGHHMFMMGLDVKTAVFFSSVTMIMGVPTGMKVFSWLYMLGACRLLLSEVIIWWMLGFIFLFTMGGVTGMVLSASVLDMMLHDTWFVVAHFHYVLSLGSYSAVVMSLMWWWPMITGYSLSKMLLQGHWFCSMAGFNLCFFPMHYVGLAGLPRRVCSYDPAFQTLNSMSTFGGLISAMSGMFLMFVLWESIASGSKMISAWGTNATVLNISVLPTPYHATYLCEHSRNSHNIYRYYY